MHAHTQEKCRVHRQKKKKKQKKPVPPKSVSQVHAHIETGRTKAQDTININNQVSKVVVVVGWWVVAVLLYAFLKQMLS